MDKEAYNKGVEARQANRPRSDCPYHFSRGQYDSAASWFLGWDAEEKEVQNRLDLKREEMNAIDELLLIGDCWGYGNCIAHLKKAWAEHLIAEHEMSKEDALKATEVEAYSLDEE